VSVSLSVRCRCWEDGLGAPVPDGVGPVRLNDDGWLELSSPAGEAWQRTACRHPGMTAADAYKGWKGVWEEVERLGQARVPLLTRIVGHRTNGGHVGWEDCRRAVAELDLLREDPLLSAWLLAPDETDGVERVDSLFLRLEPGHTVGGTEGRFRLLAAESSDIRPAGLQPPVRSDLPEPAGEPGRAVPCRSWVLAAPGQWRPDGDVLFEVFAGDLLRVTEHGRLQRTPGSARARRVYIVGFLVDADEEVLTVPLLHVRAAEAQAWDDERSSWTDLRRCLSAAMHYRTALRFV
jgi:hypothetical protein